MFKKVFVHGGKRKGSTESDTDEGIVINKTFITNYKIIKFHLFGCFYKLQIIKVN